ncbi:MAG: VOC family protein [Faecalibacillus sp.]
MVNCRIESMYLCVNDMDRAVSFYEQFFEQRVTKKDEIYSILILMVSVLVYLLMKKMNEEHIFGSNCLPSIEFLNKEVLKAKISSYKLCFPLTPIGTNWVVKIIDSEGNHIELTAPIEIVKES